jgi:hypothetical protein
MVKSWTLDDGLQLVRAIQHDTRKYGYHLALGGGVLNNGRSEKDIDLYFLPMDNGERGPKKDPDGLVGWLAKLWGKPTSIKPGDYTQEEATVEELRTEPTYSWDLETPPPTGETVIQSSPPEETPISVPTGYYMDSRGQVRAQRTTLGSAATSSMRVSASISKTVSGSYTYKYKFVRASGDRIDVFVV